MEQIAKITDKMFDLAFTPLRKFQDSPRRMKYPYTFTAKLAQFPYEFYVRNNWMYKYYFIAVFCSLPLIWKIDRLANSEASKAKWAEVLRKEEEEYNEHHH